MKFAVTLYLTIEADSEAQAREIADSIDINSSQPEAVSWESFWESFNTENEERPDL